MSRRFLLVATTVLISTAVAVASSELLLRVSGHQPWHPSGVDTNEPTMYEPDAELGWRAKEGSYVVPPYAAGSPEIRVTFLADGARSAGSLAADAPPTWVFVGCSFTQGQAISDEETFAWRLQQKFPSERVRNLGTAGYGTYQSLLVMERVFSLPDPPRLVLYGLVVYAFAGNHEVRNVADPAWLKGLDSSQKRGVVSTPYVTLDANGQLTRHAPEAYPRWPLRNHLATVTFLEDAYVYFRARDRGAQALRVTEELLLEMDRLAKRNGARFGVVLLVVPPPAKTHYADFLMSHGVDVVDCAIPNLTRRMQVPGEWHPNGRMNARWADCIAAKIGTFGSAAP